MAILLPYQLYERGEELSRQHARLDSALDAAQSVQVELPGPVSPDHDREAAAYVAGEISAAEHLQARVPCPPASLARLR